jgi:hypothetical protein
MNLLKRALLALLIMLPCGPNGALAQGNNQFDKPLDFKPLVPPVVPLPPNSRINPATVGGYQAPSTTAPLQNPNPSSNESTPGLKLTIPAR